VNDNPQSQDRQRERTEEYQRYSAYQSIRQRLWETRQTEQLLTQDALQRTGVTDPVRLYGREKDAIAPAFVAAMQWLWSIGTAPDPLYADVELRRTYHLVAKGRAPLTEKDVIYLGKLPDAELVPLLGWLAHRLSLAEAQKKVSAGVQAPPVIRIEDADDA
jgi:hypothetical protein